MIVLKMTVPGEPVGKGRPRFVRKTGIAFTPTETRRREQEIALLAKAYVDRLHTPTPPDRYRVDLAFRRSDARRVDLDNLAKLTMDALNKSGVWLDDSQVCELHATVERKSKSPGTDVTVTLL